MNLKKLWLFLPVLAAVSCARSGEKNIPEVPPEEVAVFTSTDAALQKSYEWARKTALSYAHDNSDPVGYWYEAALPKREAFCMRDVSHQSVGAQILGLDRHNKNMFSLFVENISEPKDWCSYWEINRYNKPAPADYLNDKEFWYNLNANFDVLQACLKLYRWTGDSDYVSGEKFMNFYDRSVSDYVARWNLTPDSIMHRTAYMNSPEEFDAGNSFHVCRGLPSYVENMPGVTVGLDLLAALYAGFGSYATIATLNGCHDKAAEARVNAARYQSIIENEWWDSDNDCYHTMLIDGNEFKNGEGAPYIAWFNVTQNEDRTKGILSDIQNSEWNIENISHFPALFYRYGYNEEAYSYLVSLPSMSRSEYPEVSYGVIEGCVCGAMGFRPDYVEKTVSTLSRLTAPEVESSIKNIKVFDGYMTVHHIGNDYTELSNNTSENLLWKVSFLGDYSSVEAGGKNYPVTRHTDLKGNIFTTAEIALSSNTSLKAKAYASTRPDDRMISAASF